MAKVMQLGMGEDEADDGGTKTLAERAIAFAQDHDTPLTPPVYEVWFTYSGRKNEAINDILDRDMNMSNPITEAALTELYYQHLSPRAMSEDLDELGQSLQSTMGEVSNAVDTNIQDHSQFSTALRSARQSLMQGTSKREVAEIISHLHKVNQTHIASAQRMGVQLEKNRSQVSKLEKELTELKRASNTDYLTQLANRRRLDDLLDDALFKARQKSSPVSLIMCDIDKLGDVNETWGHTAGDNVMKVYAAELRRQLNGDQVPARFAGAKFAILLPEQGVDDANAVAEKLRSSFQNFDWVAENSGDDIGKLTASFGVTELVADESKDTFVGRADRLLAEAKRSGRNQSITG